MNGVGWEELAEKHAFLCCRKEQECGSKTTASLLEPDVHALEINSTLSVSFLLTMTRCVVL